MLRYMYIFISFIFGVESAGVSALECRPTGNTSLILQLSFVGPANWNKGCNTMYNSLKYVRLIKLRSSRWKERASLSEEIINARTILAGKYERKR